MERGRGSAAVGNVGQVGYSHPIIFLILRTAPREVFAPTCINDEPEDGGTNRDSLAAQLTRRVEAMRAQQGEGPVS